MGPVSCGAPKDHVGWKASTPPVPQVPSALSRAVWLPFHGMSLKVRYFSLCDPVESAPRHDLPAFQKQEEARP